MSSKLKVINYHGNAIVGQGGFAFLSTVEAGTDPRAPGTYSRKPALCYDSNGRLMLVTGDPGSATISPIALATGAGTWRPVRVATAAALPANTYSSTTKIKTANANGALNDTGIDGLTDLAVGERVLDKNAATGSERGIFRITSLGGASAKWTMIRDDDANASSMFTDGKSVGVGEGTANGDQFFVLTTNAPITLDSTSLTFTQAPLSISYGVLASIQTISLAAAAAGVSATVARADHNHALDLSIAPTWTGIHTFQNNISQTGATTFGTGTGAVSLNGDVTVAAGKNLGGAAGAGALSFGAMTGDTTLPNGGISWTGAGGKTVSLVGAAAMTLTAGAASTWSTTAGALTLTSAAAATWSTAAGALSVSGFAGINLQIGGTTVADVGVTSATKVTLAANKSLAGAAGTGALEFGSMTGDTVLPSGGVSWTGAGGKAVSFVGAAAITLTAGAASTWSTTSGGLTLTSAAAATWSTAAGALTISGFGGTNLQVNGNTILDIGVTAGTAATLAANKNLACAAGTTAVDLSAGTGTFKTTTGNHTIGGPIVNGVTWTLASGATGSVVQRFGATTTEGFEIRVYEATVSPNAVDTNLLLLPANSVVYAVQANAEAALTGGGTTVTWSIGTGSAGDPDKYGTAGNGIGDTLAKNGKLDWTATPTLVAAGEQIKLTAAATGGAGAGDTALTVGSVRVRIVYATCNSLDDAP